MSESENGSADGMTTDDENESEQDESDNEVQN